MSGRSVPSDRLLSPHSAIMIRRLRFQVTKAAVDQTPPSTFSNVSVLVDHESSRHDALLDQLVQGDEGALGELFEEFRPRLRRMIELRLDNRLSGRIDVDDVLQEAFVDASKRVEHYVSDTSRSFYIWLRLIVEQTLADLHRRHLGAQMRSVSREVKFSQPRDHSSSMALTSRFVAHLTSPSQVAIRDEVSRQLREALDEMSPIDREVLALRHFEELSNSEVAETLEISQKAASIRYVRAIARLKSILESIPGIQDQQKKS